MEGMACRYFAPATRPAPFLFLRDLRTEAADGLLVAGKLICPAWSKPVPGRQRQELAAIASRLLEARHSGRLGQLASWIDETGIRSFTVQSVAWIRRQAADGLVVPIRVRAADRLEALISPSAA
jgi:hypothetical protein